MKTKTFALALFLFFGGAQAFAFVGRCQTSDPFEVLSFEKGTATIGCLVDQDFGWCTLLREKTEACKTVVNWYTPSTVDCQSFTTFTGNPKEKLCQFRIENVTREGNIKYSKYIGIRCDDAIQ
jgi:hypothetical protein